MELYELTVHELLEKLQKGETTSEQITKNYFVSSADLLILLQNDK